MQKKTLFMTHYALFLASLQKHARPNRFFQRAIFERSEKEPVNRHWGLKKSQIFCVRKFGMIHVYTEGSSFTNNAAKYCTST